MRVRTRIGTLIAALPMVAATLATPATAAPRADFKWVALGDAYTAGLIDATGPEVIEGTGRDGCGRTAGSYPEVLRPRFADRFELVNVSCAGATVANVMSEWQEPQGRNLPFFGVFDPDHPFGAVPPQIEAVTEDVDLVTVGVGGNTLGFIEFMYACVVIGQWAAPNEDAPCSQHFTTGWDGVPTVDDRLSALGEEYGEMLRTIRAMAPTATVIAVGYPAIIPLDPRGCDHGLTPEGIRDFATVTYPDLAWLRTDVLQRLNQLIADQAALNGSLYVDVQAITEGHDVCQPESRRWVEGIADSVGRWSLVRPNAAAHAAVADVIEALLLAGES
ncbi:SGNH/GDSL hydrolase family protein [Saccharothrix violaceirubra]|uniref:SGNH hydrolase-type esterase domain-containing protein n=1 Tax=Saccharothrix violaceirubra TaxID=413306 RepID=A0A7W7T506_9PSEU|nr:SGNH/GDSL hydrolase family protein [Saccharothrix violaceirubra]MBB4966698.1 hypothetical protein [Saccharothrix violaceirubra]